MIVCDCEVIFEKNSIKVTQGNTRSWKELLAFEEKHPDGNDPAWDTFNWQRHVKMQRAELDLAYVKALEYHSKSVIRKNKSVNASLNPEIMDLMLKRYDEKKAALKEIL